MVTTVEHEHCTTTLSKDDVMQLCALSRQRWKPNTLYCDGLNALRKRRRHSNKNKKEGGCITTKMGTMGMPDYVMLNGIEVLFIRQLYAVGIDVVSRLLEVLEFPPWDMSVLSSTFTSTSTSRTTMTRTAVQVERRRRKKVTELQMRTERSNTDNIRPIVAQFKIESEGEKFEDTVKRAFQRMRKKEGFEDIRGEIRRVGDNVYIVFYFDNEHVKEF